MGIRIFGKVLGVAALTLALVGQGVFAGSAEAGNVYLTGHDVDFHSGQNGYESLILDFLRGGATPIAAADYDILLLRTTGVGSTLSPAGFGTVTIADPISFADGAAFAAALLGKDALFIASHVNCGGCALTTAGSNAINGFSAQIASFFNAGGDIYANTGADLATYYDFLPPGAVASGAPISGSSGFDATNAGDAIGITNAMINGFPTHNRFTSFVPAFTVFETRPAAGVDCNAAPFATGCEIISLGILDARITDGGIVTDGGTVPAPAALVLLGAGLLGAGLLRRFRS
ncbi:MAG: PEP-CTERM sorting domain-containing protein [Candidatus Rokubacteria bacterium]|nr:PEP-CTERM sorting domain-containing protein [Candidatus Rokubacteria bacterium]